MGYRILGEATMLVHFAFILYVVFGGFLTWRWPRTTWIHVPIALYGLGIVVFAWACPLTHVENWARQRAGHGQLSGTGFIDHYLTGIIYPAEYLLHVQTAAGIAVLASYAGALWRHTRKPSTRTRRHAAPAGTDPTPRRRNVRS